MKGVEQIFGKNPLAFWEDFLILISMSKCFAVSVVDGLFSGEQADWWLAERDTSSGAWSALIGLHLFSHYFFVPTYLDMVIYFPWPWCLRFGRRDASQSGKILLLRFFPNWLLFDFNDDTNWRLTLVFSSFCRFWPSTVDGPIVWAMFRSSLLLYPVLKRELWFIQPSVPYYASALTGYFFIFFGWKFTPWRWPSK